MRLLPRREGLPWSATLSYLNDMRDGVPDHRFRGKGAALQLLLERFFPCPQLCFFLYGEKGGGCKNMDEWSCRGKRVFHHANGQPRNVHIQ